MQENKGVSNKVSINTSTIKAVIFDVDGTLVDSNNLHVEAWQEAFSRYGKEVGFDNLHRQMGIGFGAIPGGFV
jgi:beta-phosphoglucomutase-like phosphatase (HAD superfamily)